MESKDLQESLVQEEIEEALESVELRDQLVCVVSEAKLDLVDPKELRDQLVPRGLRESPERLVQWDFMEKEVHLVCLVQRVIMAQLDAEEIQDRLDLQENVVHKDNRDRLVWLDFQLKKEKEERVDLVEKQVH